MSRMRQARAPSGSSASASNPPAAPQRDPLSASWGALIPNPQWELFVRGTEAVAKANVRFLLHGALASATYTGRWRNTKDVDIVVCESDHERAVAALRSAGFADYYDQLAYDRSWIFRGFQDDTIFDIIWALPNHRVEIDRLWFERAQQVNLRERVLPVVPVEELVRAKLYVFQRGRCDWPDILNVLAGAADRVDWRWLVNRMGPDLPLLHGVLAVFNWLSPRRAEVLPAWIREHFALATVTGDLDVAEREHVDLLDSRPWFAAHQPLDRVLEL